MTTRTYLAAFTTMVAAVSLAGMTTPIHAADQGHKVQLAQDDAREREAFESAKDLGTVEAWDAFLSNFPNGFRADLARAYVKKLGGTAPAPAAAPIAAPPQRRLLQPRAT